MTFTGTPSIRIAHKKHCCNWCGEWVLPGDAYENTFIVCDGDAWRSKMHIECGVASREYDYDGDSIELIGQFKRGHTHEHYWFNSVHEGAAVCPGCRVLANTVVTAPSKKE